MNKNVRPFLKWPGGKFKLVDRIANKLDADATRLVEPFVGSGAVFLNTEYKEYLLADSNSHLINLFQVVQKQGTKFIEKAKKYFHSRYNTQEQYVKLRKRFNETTDDTESACLFLYLNRHGYNGLCRYNRKGGFNVPYGRHDKVYFPEKELMFFYEKAKKARFIVADFRKTMSQVKSGDTVYADPPYVPLTATSNFTAYDGNVFTANDQTALIQTVHHLAKQGVTTVMSNHNTEEIVKAYKAAGAQISEFMVRRFISCQGDKRNHAPEILAVFA